MSFTSFVKRTLMTRLYQVARLRCHPKTFSPRYLENIEEPLKDERNDVIYTKFDSGSLAVHLEEYNQVRFHHAWLRLHCQCSKCVDPKTKQRTVDLTLIPKDIIPEYVDADSKLLQIIWKDGHKTSYDMSWLKENAYDSYLGNQETMYGSIDNESELTLWGRDEIASKPPKQFKYCDIIDDNNTVLHESLNALFRYGFTFFNDTPTDEESTLKICQKIVGPIRETPEGRVYVIENKSPKDSDLSHFSGALPLHTDFSFYSDPPGVQALHCVYHHGTGGMTLLVDGFKAAKTLFQEDPEAFKILSSTTLPYVSNHFQLQSLGKVLELDPFTQALTKVRWNSSRVGQLSNMNLNFEEMEKFYEAMQLYGSILRREENELWFKLTPGKALLIDNRRVLHARSAVQGPRKLIGCYVSMDDYIGKWRQNKISQQIMMLSFQGNNKKNTNVNIQQTSSTI